MDHSNSLLDISLGVCGSLKLTLSQVTTQNTKKGGDDEVGSLWSIQFLLYTSSIYEILFDHEKMRKDK